jgi:hypothetical protein
MTYLSRMETYHKINSLYKRDDRGKFIDEFSNEYFEYLYDKSWIGTEKIDGTNIRLFWNNNEFFIGGRTNKAEIPKHLMVKLEYICDSIKSIMLENFKDVDVKIYGEGYGNKIQKIGKQYLEDDVDFILFDVKISNWWIKRYEVENIGNMLNLKTVPIVFEGSLNNAISFVKEGFKSSIGTACSEGLVLTPSVDLFQRSGERIITKLKTKDFR